MSKRTFCIALFLAVTLTSFAQQVSQVEVLYRDSTEAVYDYVISNKDGISVKNDEGRSLFVMYDDILRAVLHKGDKEIVLLDDGGDVGEMDAEETEIFDEPMERVPVGGIMMQRVPTEEGTMDELHGSNPSNGGKGYHDGKMVKTVFLGAGKKVSIYTEKRAIVINYRSYSFDRILQYAVIENDVELPAEYETRRKGVLGRALLGGALGGRTGALIGGSTARTVTKMVQPATVVTEYVVKVVVADENNPVVYIPVGNDVVKLNQVRMMLDYILNEEPVDGAN